MSIAPALACSSSYGVRLLAIACASVAAACALSIDLAVRLRNKATCMASIVVSGV